MHQEEGRLQLLLYCKYNSESGLSGPNNLKMRKEEMQIFLLRKNINILKEKIFFLKGKFFFP